MQSGSWSIDMLRRTSITLAGPDQETLQEIWKVGVDNRMNGYIDLLYEVPPLQEDDPFMMFL